MKVAISMLAVLFLQLFFGAMPVKAETNIDDSVIISSVKADGDADTEFVELYNLSDLQINLNDWYLEYAKRVSLDNQFSDCRTHLWEGQEGLEYKEKSLQDLSIDPHQTLKISEPWSRMTDTEGGVIRLVHAYVDNEIETDVVEDLVGWDGKNSKSFCYETDPVVTPDDNPFFSRCSLEDGSPSDSNDNSKDFFVNDASNPVEKPCEDEAGTDPSDPLPCESIILNEILANPQGNESTDEFIELYNPTNSTVLLKGCALRTGSSSTLFELPADTELAPGGYAVFYASDTPLELANDGGEVWLIGATQESVVQYLKTKDNESAALIGGEWKVTQQPTPGDENVLVLPEVLSSSTGGQGALEPCPAGKFRNPETNRCKNIESDDGLTPCKAGQERNPETNRCRAIGSGSVLAPCKAGYERNSETNRCRKVASDDGLKPCKAGYERNPDTNRCRKTSASNAANFAAIGAGDSAGENAPISLQWWIAIAATTGVVGYGVYEWRHEIGSFIGKLRSRFSRSAPPQE